MLTQIDPGQPPGEVRPRGDRTRRDTGATPDVQHPGGDVLFTRVEGYVGSVAPGQVQLLGYDIHGDRARTALVECA